MKADTREIQSSTISAGSSAQIEGLGQIRMPLSPYSASPMATKLLEMVRTVQLRDVAYAVNKSLLYTLGFFCTDWRRAALTVSGSDGGSAARSYLWDAGGPDSPTFTRLPAGRTVANRTGQYPCGY
eukprot:6214093-Pleurochrysis_carterae.AAC.2